MDKFNSVIKSVHIENKEYVLDGIKLIKDKVLDTNINGIQKRIEILNLPDNYNVIIGVDDNEEMKVKNKVIFCKFYFKVYDVFNREINDFQSHHKLASGIDVKIKLTNINSPKVSIQTESSKIGYFDSEENEFSFTVYNDKPVEIVSAKANSGNSTDPSNWWIIGGIIFSVIIICAALLYYNLSVKKSVIKSPELYNKVGVGNVDMVYKTPRFPPRYYNFY
jgi:hypothetical protein